MMKNMKNKKMQKIYIKVHQNQNIYNKKNIMMMKINMMIVLLMIQNYQKIKVI